jgi:hypothetical protein
MVNLTKARHAQLDAALIGDIHHDRLRLPYLQLGLDAFLQGAARNRDFSAHVRGQAGGGHTDPRLPPITTTYPPSRVISRSLCL